MPSRLTNTIADSTTSTLHRHIHIRKTCFIGTFFNSFNITCFYFGIVPFFWTTFFKQKYKKKPKKTARKKAYSKRRNNIIDYSKYQQRDKLCSNKATSYLFCTALLGWMEFTSIRVMVNVTSDRNIHLRWAGKKKFQKKTILMLRYKVTNWGKAINPKLEKLNFT